MLISSVEEEPAKAAERLARTQKKASIGCFHFLQFLCYGEYRELQDPTMSGLCLLIKACTVAIFLLFVFLMFGPIFLPGGR